jgi:phage shock protein PspC (stress-responsive transcriptional regulator)
MSKKQKKINKREKDIKGLGTTHGLAQTLRPSPSSYLVFIIIIIIIIKEMNDILFIFYFILFFLNHNSQTCDLRCPLHVTTTSVMT